MLVKSRSTNLKIKLSSAKQWTNDLVYEVEQPKASTFTYGVCQLFKLRTTVGTALCSISTSRLVRRRPVNTILSQPSPSTLVRWSGIHAVEAPQTLPLSERYSLAVGSFGLWLASSDCKIAPGHNSQPPWPPGTMSRSRRWLSSYSQPITWCPSRVEQHSSTT